ncbi:MAG: phosphatase PAP2 family protein [Bacteroidota bacterium]
MLFNIIKLGKTLVFTFFAIATFAQNHGITTIHLLEPAKNHYKTLQLLSASPNETYADSDTLAFPPSMYNSYALAMSQSTPHYLTSSQVDFLKKSVHFPANSSDQTRAELDFLYKLQNEREEKQVERVMQLAKIGYWPVNDVLENHPKYQQNLDYLFFECQEVVGTDCTAQKYPHTANLLKGIMTDMRIMEFAVKYQLLRARPYELDKRLQPLQVMGSPSFASGHTLWAYIQAFTFSELMPEKRPDFLAIAYELGLSREIMAVHYPSDEETARQLAHRMLWLMWHTEKFQTDFKKAQTEWK